MSPPAWAATRTFSSTLLVGKTFVIWYDRWTPMRAVAAGSAFVTSRQPSSVWSSTAPSLGASTPVRRLKNVVFPAPFGPMSEHSSSPPSSKSTWSTATRPPNRRVNPRVRNIYSEQFIWSLSSGIVVSSAETREMGSLGMMGAPQESAHSSDVGVTFATVISERA